MKKESGMEQQAAPPSIEDILKWSTAAMQSLPVELVRNAWRHDDYTWFP